VAILKVSAFALAAAAVLSVVVLLGVIGVALAPTGIDPVAFELPVGALLLVQTLLCPAAWFVSALNRRFNRNRAAIGRTSVELRPI
jgi:hypothetical protein